MRADFVGEDGLESESGSTRGMAEPEAFFDRRRLVRALDEESSFGEPLLFLSIAGTSATITELFLCCSSCRRASYHSASSTRFHTPSLS